MLNEELSRPFSRLVLYEQFFFLNEKYKMSLSFLSWGSVVLKLVMIFPFALGTYYLHVILYFPSTQAG